MVKSDLFIKIDALGKFLMEQPTEQVREVHLPDTEKILNTESLKVIVSSNRAVAMLTRRQTE